ncbi:hypothetical protein EYF80_044115 [Liparis tanakae]|uniref:Uncharacterized protein n=1 Tax=Liparis tanakae TaxID=230148 RepID=A0A4Z2FWP4_9TELE|nr:hypothetical protein EYF80_044115 [Liparis tanakae]
MRNLVRRSGSRPFSLERIISSMSPCSFSITTNTFSGVSNMHSRFTMPSMATSFLSWLSCLVGKRSLSMTLTATSLPDFLCFPDA